MATRTRRPTRTSASIEAAPSYSGVASNYSSQFAAAIESQRVAELNNRVLAYKQGSLSFNDLRNYINDYVDDVGANTSNGSDALSILVDVTEEENSRRVQSKMNELMTKYMEGGVSNEERLNMILEVKEIANPNSDIYNELLAEEAKVRGAIEEEAAAAGAGAISNAVEDQLIKNQGNLLVIANEYQQDQYFGGEILEQAIIDEINEAEQAIEEARARGIDVSNSDLTMTDPILGKQLPLDIIKQRAISRLEARTAGIVFDVVDDSGNFVPVTIAQVQQDILRNPDNPKYQRFNYDIEKGPGGFGNVVVGPDGSQVPAEIAEKYGGFVDEETGVVQFSSEENAAQAAREAFGGGYQLAVKTPQGVEEFSYDPETTTFTDQQGNYYMSVPTTQQQRESFRYDRPEGVDEGQWRQFLLDEQDNYMRAATSSGRLENAQIATQAAQLDLGDVEAPVATEVKGNGIFKRFGDFVSRGMDALKDFTEGREFQYDAPEEGKTTTFPTTTQGFGLGSTLKGGLETSGFQTPQFKSFGTPQFGLGSADVEKPSLQKVDVQKPKFDFQMPKFDFKLPKIDFGEVAKGAAKGIGLNIPSGPSMTAPTQPQQTQEVGLLGKAKSVVSNTFNKFKNLLGFGG